MKRDPGESKDRCRPDGMSPEKARSFLSRIAWMQRADGSGLGALSLYGDHGLG
jgi:hypothetical protein